MKKLVIAALAGVASMSVVVTDVIADWAPAGPIKMMIAFRAGGGADTQARMIAEEIEARRGWKVIPEQVTGKGGAVLAASLKDQPNDGTVIGIAVTETYGYNMVSAKKPAYAQSDFTHLTTTAGFQMGIVSLSSKGWNTFPDVIAAAKAGESVSFGAMSPKLADLAYMLGQANGVEFNIVMVKGGKGVMNGLNAGDLDVGWGAGIQTKAVKAGDMVNLASGLSTPLSLTPDAPLLSDMGVDFNSDGYFLFSAPAGLSDEARAALADVIQEIVNDPETKVNGLLTKAFGGAITIGGAQLDALMAADEQAAQGLLSAVSE
ncbi:MAG: tripartite tricarboxylate transporter substrate-binding protein [Pikeienuella sp.]